MKPNNMVMYNTFLWNWSKSVICDNTILFMLCTSEVIGDKIRWLIAKEQATLGLHILKIQGCIELINGGFH
jgi:hypothetical protein